ncbi:MAG: tetratricopeptide repeat protein [Spirochaetales bacterium]|nr:tetratricopeptide repeat protein [Spirochaetales bacterium]
MKKRGILLAVLSCILASALPAQNRPDALASYRAGDYERAIEICLEEIEALPRSRDSYAVLGWSLINLQRYEDALTRGNEAYQFAPNDPRIIEILGEANFFLGQNLDALRYFERYAVLADTGDRIDRIYYFMGEIFIRLGEFHHADIAFSTALYHSPNFSSWWGRLGYAREMAKDYANSLEAYDNALALNPNLLEADRGRKRVQSAMQQ